MRNERSTVCIAYSLLSSYRRESFTRIKRIKSSKGKMVRRMRKSVFTRIIPTNLDRGTRDGFYLTTADARRTRSRTRRSYSAFPALSRLLRPGVVGSSIKIPTGISHSPGGHLLSDRRDRQRETPVVIGVVRHANVAEFHRAIFLPAQFQRLGGYTYRSGNGRGTVNG